MKRVEIGKPMGLAISAHCSVNLPRPLMVAIRHVTRGSIAFATPNRLVRAIELCNSHTNRLRAQFAGDRDQRRSNR